MDFLDFIQKHVKICFVFVFCVILSDPWTRRGMGIVVGTAERSYSLCSEFAEEIENFSGPLTQENHCE